MGRHSKKFNTGAKLWEAFEEYISDCNLKTVTKTEFSQKECEFITKKIPHPVSVNLSGFCSYVGMSYQNFYETYMKNPKFDTVIARMRTYCENDAREKFENGTIDPRLASLWMGHNYGYSQKQETTITTAGTEEDPLSAAFKKLIEGN